MAHKLKARQIRASWKYTGLGWLCLCGEDSYSGGETWNLIPVTIQIHRNKCNLHDTTLKAFQHCHEGSCFKSFIITVFLRLIYNSDLDLAEYLS